LLLEHHDVSGHCDDAGMSCGDSSSPANRSGRDRLAALLGVQTRILPNKELCDASLLCTAEERLLATATAVVVLLYLVVPEQLQHPPNYLQHLTTKDRCSLLVLTEQPSPRLTKYGKSHCFHKWGRCAHNAGNVDEEHLLWRRLALWRMRKSDRLTDELDVYFVVGVRTASMK